MWNGIAHMIITKAVINAGIKKNKMPSVLESEAASLFSSKSVLLDHANKTQKIACRPQIYTS